jgi:hypothetical protein
MDLLMGLLMRLRMGMPVALPSHDQGMYDRSPIATNQLIM